MLESAKAFFWIDDRLYVEEKPYPLTHHRLHVYDFASGKKLWDREIPKLALVSVNSKYIGLAEKNWLQVYYLDGCYLYSAKYTRNIESLFSNGTNFVVLLSYDDKYYLHPDGGICYEFSPDSRIFSLNDFSDGLWRNQRIIKWNPLTVQPRHLPVKGIVSTFSDKPFSGKPCFQPHPGLPYTLKGGDVRDSQGRVVLGVSAAATAIFWENGTMYYVWSSHPTYGPPSDRLIRVDLRKDFSCLPRARRQELRTLCLVGRRRHTPCYPDVLKLLAQLLYDI